MLRYLRSDLGRIAVNGLLAAENDVESAFCLLQLFYGRLKGIAGGQGIRCLLYTSPWHRAARYPPVYGNDPESNLRACPELWFHL